jgi:hypothetical protein
MIKKPFLKNAIKDSVALFREIFGRIPRVFVPGKRYFPSGSLIELQVTRDQIFVCGPFVTYLHVNGGALKLQVLNREKKGRGITYLYPKLCF